MKPLTWNANRERIGTTARGRPISRTDFHVKWVNYLHWLRYWRRYTPYTKTVTDLCF